MSTVNIYWTQPCPKKIRMQHCLSILGSRVLSPLRCESDKSVTSLVLHCDSFLLSAKWKDFPFALVCAGVPLCRTAVCCLFCLCMLRGVLGPQMGKGRVMNFTGRLFSSEHNRWFATDNTPLQILRDNDRRITLTANRIPLSQWFNEQCDKLRQSIRQPIQPKKNRGLKL